MGIISKPTTFVAGTTKSGEAAQVNADFDTLYNEFNGNIEDANVKSTAAIAQSKISGLANSILYAAGLVAGTRMIFHQTAAPTGWTKDTTSGLNNSALRIVTGTASSGGALGFSAVMVAALATTAVSSGTTDAAAPGSTDGFTLTTNEMPSHGHDTPGQGQTLQGGGANLATVDDPGRKTTDATGGGAAHAHGHSTTHTHGVTATHSHASALNVLYQDVIIAQKA